eukprot:37000-Chlamydomonas_euryale.AAC.2
MEHARSEAPPLLGDTTQRTHVPVPLISPGVLATTCACARSTAWSTRAARRRRCWATRWMCRTRWARGVRSTRAATTHHTSGTWDGQRPRPRLRRCAARRRA